MPFLFARAKLHRSKNVGIEIKTICFETAATGTIRVVGTLFTWMLIIACSDRATDSAVDVVDPPSSQQIEIQPDITEDELLTEQLMACSHASVVTAYQYLCLKQDGAWWVDESVSDHFSLGRTSRGPQSAPMTTY